MEYERINADPIFDKVRKSHEDRYELAANYVGPSDIVIDAACGTGYGKRFLDCKEYFGIDKYDGEDREKGKNHIVADLNSWQPDFDFDVLISLETIEHIENFMNIIEIAKKSDRFIFSVPIIPTKHQNTFHLNDFTVYGVHQVIEKELPKMEIVFFMLQDDLYGIWVLRKKAE